MLLIGGAIVVLGLGSEAPRGGVTGRNERERQCRAQDLAPPVPREDNLAALPHRSDTDPTPL
jgi:transposase